MTGVILKKVSRQDTCAGHALWSVKDCSTGTRSKLHMSVPFPFSAGSSAGSGSVNHVHTADFFAVLVSVLWSGYDDERRGAIKTALGRLGLAAADRLKALIHDFSDPQHPSISFQAAQRASSTQVFVPLAADTVPTTHPKMPVASDAASHVPPQAPADAAAPPPAPAPHALIIELKKIGFPVGDNYVHHITPAAGWRSLWTEDLDHPLDDAQLSEQFGSVIKIADSGAAHTVRELLRAVDTGLVEYGHKPKQAEDPQVRAAELLDDLWQGRIGTRRRD